MDDYECAGFTFNSNFDSGNLRHVEYIRRIPSGEDTKTDIFNGIEFKLYTKPDCAGTAYENGNRTWFFFSVRGGESLQCAKFYIMNLNRQAKLYGQGMQPVVRIGKYGKWERIKDKPSFQMDNHNFILTFLHRIPENPNTLVYYAFTYPYTCTELAEYLARLDLRFARTPREIEFIINKLTLSSGASSNQNNTCDTAAPKSDNNQEVLGNRAETIGIDVNSGNIISSDSSDYETATSTDTKANESNHAATGGTPIELKKIETLRTYQGSDLQNEIYYYRELLIYSLEGRRVDLVTITSFHGITEDTEPVLENLFPESKRKRCHIFKNKKVIFLSSRVHPGETPASFILNGFINFILDKKNIIASILRSMYIFKIVPFLNPDGVYNGMYRSDTLGQNLNRVYLNPKIETQPTIYAARKLIRFYHYGYDKKEHFENEKKLGKKDKKTETSYEIKENVLSPKPNVAESVEVSGADTKEGSISSLQSTASAASSSSNNDGDHGNTEMLPEFDSNQKSSDTSLSPLNSLDSSNACLNLSINSNIKKKNFVKQNKTSIIKTPCSGGLKLAKFNNSTSGNTGKDHRPKSAPNTENKLKSGGANERKKLITRKELKAINTGNRSPMYPVILGSTSNQHQAPLHRTGSRLAGHYKNTEYLLKHGDEKMLGEEKCNLFLYIDFHGHASKKGVFMYGNHLPNSWEAVDCMLLPRLMSMNCAHFHFDACNFSERNMYLKGKRDGLSKEGSGRVAMYKSIGLIKSYTLESNYNTGKIVNILPMRAKDVVPQKMTALTPPKYSPAIFEDVGRALGPSILDLTNSNPSSRIINSEFRTLQGLRNALKTEIDRSFNARCSSANSSKSSRPKSSRRLKNKSNKSSSNYSRAGSSNADALKENKALYEMSSSWDLLQSGSNTNNSNTSNSIINSNINVSLENNSLVILPLQTTIQQTLSNNNNIMQTNQTLTSCDTTPSLTLSTSTSTSTLLIHPISSPSVVTIVASEHTVKTKKLASTASFKAKKVMNTKGNQTLYGKKEKNSTSSKKIKTFCDSQIAGTSGTTDQPITQVPRKRIKVSQHAIAVTTSLSNTILKPSYAKIDLIESNNLSTSILIPITTQIKDNNDIPCCSHSLKRSNTTIIKGTTISSPIITTAAIIHQQQQPLQIQTAGSSSSSSQPSSSNSGMTSAVAAGAGLVPGTSFVVKSIGAFRASSKPNAGGSGGTSGTMLNPLRKSNSLPNLSKKLSFDRAPALATTKKIKKKRIIKNETTMTGLKRKKSRVKTGWH